MAYSQEKLDSQQLFDYSKLGQEMAVNIAVGLADTKHNQFCLNSDWTEVTERLTKNMTDLLDLEQNLNNCIKASVVTEQTIRQLVNESETSEEISLSDIKVDDIFENNLAEIVAKDETKLEDNVNYQKLSEVLKEFSSEGNENDEELMALDTESEQIPIDPFSKKEIQFPVKNKTCGHVYDREQLRLVLGSRDSTARLRCPNVGCNNRSVTLNDVIEDKKTLALIQKLKRNRN